MTIKRLVLVLLVMLFIVVVGGVVVVMMMIVMMMVLVQSRVDHTGSTRFPSALLRLAFDPGGGR